MAFAHLKVNLDRTGKGSIILDGKDISKFTSGLTIVGENGHPSIAFIKIFCRPEFEGDVVMESLNGAVVVQAIEDLDPTEVEEAALAQDVKPVEAILNIVKEVARAAQSGATS